MIVNDSKKSSKIFICKKCDYYTSRNSQWNRHLLTDKHNINENDSNSELNDNTLVPKSSNNYTCNCGKVYKYNSGYFRHKIGCNFISNDKDNTNQKTELSDKELITMLVKQNTELMGVIKNGTNNNVNSNNNSNNKIFNLQFFLNETCKNAINISDFVSSIKPQIADLEATGRLGYVEGVSNIILNNLNTMDTHERPIHCSDNKREILYIKENNEWTKEDDNKPILTKAIKIIANENIKNINEWKKTNPDCTDSDSKKNNMYLKIVSNAMSGATAEESSKNIFKIISNVAKEVVINKQ